MRHQPNPAVERAAGAVLIACAWLFVATCLVAPVVAQIERLGHVVATAGAP